MHTQDMAAEDAINTQGSDGSNFRSRAEKNGFEEMGGTQLIGAGYPSPEEFVKTYMSKGTCCLFQQDRENRFK
jgi:uncharacterized protein YkwD